MRISDWSSDVCSSDLLQLAEGERVRIDLRQGELIGPYVAAEADGADLPFRPPRHVELPRILQHPASGRSVIMAPGRLDDGGQRVVDPVEYLHLAELDRRPPPRSEEHTSELQSLMRNSYAVFC